MTHRCQVHRPRFPQSVTISLIFISVRTDLPCVGDHAFAVWVLFLKTADADQLQVRRFRRVSCHVFFSSAERETTLPANHNTIRRKMGIITIPKKFSSHARSSGLWPMCPDASCRGLPAQLAWWNWKLFSLHFTHEPIKVEACAWPNSLALGLSKT